MIPATVTVCIPTYNRAGLLRSTIGSVLAQSFEDYTLVVADNASEDDTEAVVRGFDDPRVRYLRHETNIGPYANFNVCLRTAESEFVMLLCDDDLLQPSFLQTAVAALQSEDRAGFVYSTWRRRMQTGVVDDEVVNLTGLTERTILPGRAFVERVIHQSFVAHMSGVLMRTAAVPEDGFDARDGFAMDFGLLLRIAARWDAIFLPQPLLTVRQATDSLTGQLVGVGADGRVSWDIDADVRRRDVKLRFLEGQGGDLPNVAQLRGAVHRYFRCRVMWHSATALRRGGHLRAARRALADGRAVDPKVVWDPYAWRSGLAVLAGSTLTNLLGGSRR